MENNNATKKHGNITVSLLLFLFTILFIGSFAYLLYCVATNKNNDMIPSNVRHITEWTCQVEDGPREAVVLPNNAVAQKGQMVAFETRLPDDITDGEWLALLNSKDLIVKIDGVDRYEWRRDAIDVPGGPTKAVFMFVPLRGEDAGKTITIIKYGPTYNGSIHDVIIGDSLSVINELKRSMGYFQFILSIILFAISIIVIAVGIFLRIGFKQDINLIPIGMTVMAASSWLVLNSNVFQLEFGIRYVDGFLSYVIAMTMIFPFLAYFDQMQNRRFNVLYSVLAAIELLNFVICTLLHVTRKANYSETLMGQNMIMGVIIAFVFGCVIYDIAKGYYEDYSYAAIGMLAFIGCAVIEIALINIVGNRVDGAFILVGLFVFLCSAMAQQIEDIKREERIRNELAEASEAKNHFLTNMSHEIRTPINSILGMNEMILQESDSQEVREYARRIEHSGQILMSMVNDILDYSTFKTGKDVIVSHTYNVHKMIEGVVVVLKEIAALKGIGVNIGLPGDLPELLCGDERHVSRVLSNITNNAVKYTEKGNVTFAVECEENEDGYLLTFYIKDTGVGIKAEEMPNLFKAFERADLKNNRAVAGAGLGLAITKQLVDDMGGEITVESEYGVGSMFIVTIPQKKAISGDAAGYRPVSIADEINSDELEILDSVQLFDDSSSLSVNKSENSDEAYIAPDARILAVDDNNANLIVVREFLKKIQSEVEVVSSGAEAIEICKKKKYDIILMDHMMPEPDGIAAMHTIRDSLESLNRKTKIIVLTANVIGDCRSTYISEGFDNYLSKPIDRAVLLKTVRMYLDPKLILPVTGDDMSGADDASDTSKASSDESNKDVLTKLSNLKNSIIDFTDLFNRFEGQQNVVNMILAECVKESDRKIELLRKLFEEKDIARYAVEAHGIKGVMASISANDFSAHAKKHEFAAKDSDVDYIGEDIESFIDEYRDVVSFIENYLGEQGITVEKTKVIEANASGDSVEVLINKAQQALDDFDVDNALKVLSELSSAVSEGQMAIVQKATQYADDFEYDLAKQCLKELY